MTAVSVRRMPNAVTITPLTSSSNGTVPSHGSPSTVLWSFAFESTWSHLESRNLAPGTVNLRLGFVQRLACEAADSGLLSPDLPAGIGRVKGVKKLGVRLGNWLTVEQATTLWQTRPDDRLQGKRDRALLAVLLACGLRHHEAASLEMRHIQEREDHWAIVHFHGKAGHTRTVPVPDWVKKLLDRWTQAAVIQTGKTSTSDEGRSRLGNWDDREVGVACGPRVCRCCRHRHFGSS